jgi:hypothetical protein
MDWVLHNLRLLIFIAGAIVYYLNARRKAAEARASKPATSAPQTREQQVSPAGEIAEESRRIQEEIRRTIQQRRAQRVPPVVMRPPPVLRPPEPEDVPRPVEIPVQRSMKTTDENAEASLLERQRRMAEQLRQLEEQGRTSQQMGQLEEQRRRADQRVADVAAYSQSSGEASPSDIDWAYELRDPRSVRRAVLLREIFGPPVGLR